MGIVRKNNRIVEEGDQPVSAMANFMDTKENETETAKQGMRNGPGVASGAPAPKPVDPFTTRVRDPQAADAAWYRQRMDELEPYAVKAEAIQAEINAVLADPANVAFLTQVRGFNFALAFQNVTDELDGNAREKARDQIHRLRNLTNTLNVATDDAPGGLAREIRSLDIAALKARPGLNWWKQHPSITRDNVPIAAQFQDLKVQIEHLYEQVKARFNTPRLRSEDERDFGFNVDRTRPAAPSKSNAAFYVMSYDRGE